MGSGIAAAGDLITNEMLGNGAGVDEGNLIVLSGALLSGPAAVPALAIGWRIAVATLLALLGALGLRACARGR